MSLADAMSSTPGNVSRSSYKAVDDDVFAFAQAPPPPL